METHELEVGKVYKVYMNDCCVVGSFTAKLIEKIDEDIDSKLWFENGVYLACIGGCEFREVVND